MEFEQKYSSKIKTWENKTFGKQTSFAQNFRLVFQMFLVTKINGNAFAKPFPIIVFIF